MMELKNQNPKNLGRPFHLTLDVPHDVSRAKSLCGASLRTGARYDTVEHYIRNLERDWADEIIRASYVNAFIRDRNRNKYCAWEREDYLGNICQRCLEHPEYALAALADLP